MKMEKGKGSIVQIKLGNISTYFGLTSCGLVGRVTAFQRDSCCRAQEGNRQKMTKRKTKRKVITKTGRDKKGKTHAVCSSEMLVPSIRLHGVHLEGVHMKLHRRLNLEHHKLISYEYYQEMENAKFARR